MTGGGANADGENVVRGRCGDCGHVWVVVHPPMPLDAAARLMKRAACPKCACEKVFVAMGESA